MSLNKTISYACLGLLVCTPIVAVPSAAFSRELSNLERSRNEQTSIVREIDVFGTEQITAWQVRQALGDEITQFAEAIYSEHPNTDSSLEELYQKIIDSIQTMGDFAYVDISPIMYFEEENPIYVTIDVVDRVDASVRMPFHPKPTQTFSDPDSLLQTWTDYEMTGFELSRAGELREGINNCPALACTVGFDHPNLEGFLSFFETEILHNRDQLIQILQADENEVHRGNAVYLLAFAFLDDPESYVETITPAIKDSSSLVRNNALRVLGDISHNYPEVDLPVAAIIEALQYPATTDRNKASWRLLELAKQDRYHQLIIEQAVPVLLEMLKLQQPNNHDPAYATLKAISGEQYGSRDYAAWEQWAAHQ
ncbi:MAG: HEAT repeat domain-containing protein [Cyanobacteria bacterium P01_H01_bin.21]